MGDPGGHVVWASAVRAGLWGGRAHKAETVLMMMVLMVVVVGFARCIWGFAYDSRERRNLPKMQRYLMERFE